MTAYRFTLNVLDLSRSTEFYRIFFNRVPGRVTADSVAFELTDPPLVVVLEQTRTGKVTPLAAQGIRMSDRAAVLAERERLHRAGLKTQIQECSHCGYHEQFKVHVADPDGHYWNLFAIDRDVPPEAVHRCLEGEEAHLPADPVEHGWTAPDGFTGSIPYRDGALDEVRLGILPAPSLVGEAYRVLRPWGVVRVAGTLAAESLSAVGFRGVEVVENELIGIKPDPLATRVRQVIYKGPFLQVRDDAGNVFRRGQRVRIDDAAWTLLRRGTSSAHFLFLYPHPIAEIRPDLAALENLA